MIDVASYVPGTLQFSGSPLLETLRIRYCRFCFAVIAHCRSWAVARRGFSRYQAGSPVTNALKPSEPPNNPRRPVSYTHLRAHETPEHLVCRLLLEKKK